MVNVPDVTDVLSEFDKKSLVKRIWEKDHTVWKSEPKEIADRLGWLTLPEDMQKNLEDLVAFADEIRQAGYAHVVLLGMGGASLGAEVLGQTLGGAAGYPQLLVLDSTLPAWIQSVVDVIDPARTLFLVSSKSGGTLETLSLYKFFRELVARKAGEAKAGRNFVAITDKDTSLARLADETGFRRAFLNPEDVGGRYSVLSYFGLVPGALTGVDIKKLLRRADGMKKTCAGTGAADNSGAWLGGTIGAMTLQGRDKLTLVTSPSLRSFGLWLEQLIAESTGKEGKGIIPVMGEPLAEPEWYGEDRLFVYLRLEGDDNAGTDAALEKISSSGKMVITLKLEDKYDIGAEFYRWEFATAVAGAVLGINPFDQPNVQAAKDATDSVLREYHKSGQLPALDIRGSLEELLSQAKKNDYLAIMAYMRQTPETEKALTDLRCAVMKKYRIATTSGYGPRLLHSTGQLHKGGPNTGLLLQVTTGHERQLPIPGEEYSFNVLVDAQALGDLRTLHSLGRRCTRLHLEQGDGAALQRMASSLRK